MPLAGEPAFFQGQFAVAETSFQELVDEHYDRLFRAALFMSGDRQVAEELVQESFLAAAESIHRFEGRSSIYTWLYGILRNKFRRWLRKKGKTVSLQLLEDRAPGDENPLSLKSEETHPPDRVESEETAEIIREIVDELPPHHRDVLVLRYMEDYSYKEIAEALDCSIGTVKSRIHYALDKVGHRLRTKGGFEDS